MILESQIEVQKLAFEYAGAELYENIGQVLSVAKLQLHALEDSQLNQQQQQFLHQTTHLLDKAIVDLRALIRTLESYLKKDFDLSLNLSIEIERMRKLLQKNIELSIKGKPFQLKYEKEIVIFRVVQNILQQLLTNSINITVSLSYESNLIIGIVGNEAIHWTKQHQKLWEEVGNKTRLINAASELNSNGIVIQITT